MLALPWKCEFGDTLTNMRDSILSIFVKKESRALDTKFLRLATWPAGASTVAKCVCTLKDKNDDCIYNEPEQRSFAEVIKYIRNESKFDTLFLLKCQTKKLKTRKLSPKMKISSD